MCISGSANGWCAGGYREGMSILSILLVFLLPLAELYCMRKLWKEAVRLLTCVVAMEYGEPEAGTRFDGPFNAQETKNTIIAPSDEAELHK